MSAAGRCGATELQPSVVLPHLRGRATPLVYDGALTLNPGPVRATGLGGAPDAVSRAGLTFG